MNNVRLEKSTHTYFVGDKAVPGVSSILKTFGIIPDFRGIDKREKGTAVHEITELDDLGILDMYDYDDSLSGYLEAWRNAKKAEDFSGSIVDIKTGSYYPYYKLQTAGYLVLAESNKISFIDMIEPSLYSPEWGFCGTPDRIYAKNSEKVTRRICVILSDDGGYKICPQTEDRDIQIFKSLLTTYNLMSEKVRNRWQTQQG